MMIVMMVIIILKVKNMNLGKTMKKIIIINNNNKKKMLKILKVTQNPKIKKIKDLQNF